MKHSARRMAPILALLLALSGGAAAEQLTCIVPGGQYVNVRNQAASSAATWGVLHRGDVIEADPGEITRGFFKTTYKDREAYVSVKFFEIAAGEDYAVEANGRVRLRKAPGGSAVGFIQPGQRVHVMAWRYAPDGSRWARCAGGGYIAAQYLEKIQ